MPYPLIWTHVAVLFLFLWHSVLKGRKICATKDCNFFHFSAAAVTFIQIRKAKWILGFLKFPKIVFSNWVLWNHWVLLSLSKGCLPAMITIVIHKRSPAKISTKIFARHRHRQHDHGDGQTVLPLTWLNWFHIHNNPNYFSAMIFRLTSNWFLFHVKLHLLVCVVSRDDDYLNLNCCIPWYQISF